MRQQVFHAIVDQNGAHFAVVQVKDYVVTNANEARKVHSSLMPVYQRPLALIGERNGRTWGDPNIVNLLSRIHLGRLPWSRAYIDVPSAPSGGTGVQANDEVVTWVGESGTKYRYTVHPLNALPSLSFDGNYIFTYASSDLWVPLYIGQGNLKDRIGPNHHRWTCVVAKGATHVHIHRNGREQDRLSEESDLLSAWPEAYAPTGCNERPGG